MSKRRVAAVGLAALLIGGGAGLFVWSSAESPADSTQAARVGTRGPGAPSDGAASPAADALDAAMRPGAGAPRTRARSSPGAPAGTDGAAPDVATALPASRAAAEWVDRLITSGVEAAGPPLAVDQYGDADLARIVGFVLDRTLPLDVAPGATLAPLVTGFLERVPGHPLPRDAVYSFIAQDRTGLGWLLAWHVPAEDRMASFASLLGSGPPWPEAGAAMRDDGVRRLLPIVYRDDPSAVLRLIADAARSREAPRASRAVIAAALELNAFAGLIADAARSHPDGDVRRTALGLLIEHLPQCHDTALVAPAILDRAANGGPHERSVAIGGLGGIGPAGIDLAAALLADSDDEAEVRALDAVLIRSNRADVSLNVGFAGPKLAAFLAEMREIGSIHAQLDNLEIHGGDITGELTLAGACSKSLETVRDRAAEVPFPAGELASSWAEVMLNVGRADLVIERLRSSATPRDARVALLAPWDLPHAEVNRAAEFVLTDADATDEELGEVIERLGDDPFEPFFGTPRVERGDELMAGVERAALLRRFVAGSRVAGAPPRGGDATVRELLVRAAEKIAARLEASEAERKLEILRELESELERRRERPQ